MAISVDGGAMKRGVGGWVLAVIFGLLLAHDVWEGIGNVSGMLQIGLQLDLQPQPIGWLVLATDLLAPIVVFVVALLATRKTNLWQSLLIWLLALLVSAIVGANVVLAWSNLDVVFAIQ
jgi:hypothetical protein